MDNLELARLRTAYTALEVNAAYLSQTEMINTVMRLLDEIDRLQQGGKYGASPTDTSGPTPRPGPTGY